jgi:tetratricopeptide (TPR) repeat protein
LFSEGREKFAKPFASAIAGEELDEAVAALLHFALVERETISDERDPSITTDCIRLHRLVREVAAARAKDEARNGMLRELADAVAAVYPRDVFSDPKGWPRARRLDALALALADDGAPPASGTETSAFLLDRLGSYRHGALAAYAEARRCFEKAAGSYERVLGGDHPSTAASLNNLASLLQDQGDYVGARPLFERALQIYEKALGPDHPVTATTLNNLAFVLKSLGHLFRSKAALRAGSVDPQKGAWGRSSRYRYKPKQSSRPALRSRGLWTGEAALRAGTRTERKIAGRGTRLIKKKRMNFVHDDSSNRGAGLNRTRC